MDLCLPIFGFVDELWKLHGLEMEQVLLRVVVTLKVHER